MTDDLKALVLSLEARVGSLEGGKGGKPAPAPAPAKAAPAEDDDEVDLFGSDSESDSEEKKRITEERLKAYNEKKAKKPKVIAKTSVLLDVKVRFFSPVFSSPLTNFLSPGTMRQTTTRCWLPSRVSRWTVSSGEPASSFPSGTASRSCR